MTLPLTAVRKRELDISSGMGRALGRKLAFSQGIDHSLGCGLWLYLVMRLNRSFVPQCKAF